MSKYNRIIMITVAVILLMAAAVNIFITTRQSDDSKYYLVEINRAYKNMIENGFDDKTDQYQYIKEVSLLPADADSSEINAFFDNDSAPYLIKIIGEKEVSGYVKFTYSTNKKNNLIPVQFIVTAAILIMGVFIMFVLLYIKSKIIKPFNEISQFPYELSKGHLTKGLKENKNQYFGRFIWGLDLLRENLEVQKNRQLALNKEKKALVLSISHDIKTPLSAISLYTKALSKKLYDDEKRDVIISNIGKKVDEIEGFVGSLIKSSKEDFLDIEVNNTEFYLKDLLIDLQEYYKEKLDDISCQFMIGDYQNCLIYGDRNRALEVLENIIENAIKYGDGKRIDITVDAEEDAQLVTVINTGTPLPSHELVHMWESFWRGSNVKDKTGTGLGLYICRRIMTMMKGDIYSGSVASGMSFTIVFKKV